MEATDLERKMKVNTDFETMISEARQQMKDGKSRKFDTKLKTEILMRLFQKK